MPPRQRRPQFVQMDDILDAMATTRPGAPTFYLDTDSGRIELAMESPADGLDRESGRYQLIPRIRARFRRERLLEEALAWLGGIGIDPQYELRPVARANARKGKAGKGIGLHDLLLLGRPDGPTERRNGRVERRVLASSRAEAREIFLRIARELCTHHGRSWRTRLVEGRDRYEVDRFMLIVSDREVALSVAVPVPIWGVFHPR